MSTPKAQRIGVVLLGLIFVLSGTTVAAVYRSGDHWLIFPIGVVLTLTGLRILWNVLHKNDLPNAKHINE
jgi:hypothetical protein